METLKEGVEELYAICPACDAEYKWKTKEGYVKTCLACGCPMRGVSERAFMIAKQAARAADFFSMAI